MTRQPTTAVYWKLIAFHSRWQAGMSPTDATQVVCCIPSRRLAPVGRSNNSVNYRLIKIQITSLHHTVSTQLSIADGTNRLKTIILTRRWGLSAHSWRKYVANEIALLWAGGDATRHRPWSSNRSWLYKEQIPLVKIATVRETERQHFSHCCAQPSHHHLQETIKDGRSESRRTLQDTAGNPRTATGRRRTAAGCSWTAIRSSKCNLPVHHC